MLSRMDLTGKRILVTGGTGSLGQVLVRRLLSGERGTPRKIIVLSRDEAKQHEMRLSYQHLEGSTDEVIYHNFSRLLEFRIGDVRSYADVCGAVRDADIVFNAAALKQVPICEYFPEQAVLTNCIGAGQRRPGDPRAGRAGRNRRRHQHRQGLQAGQRDGHDQGDRRAHLHRGQRAQPAHAVRVRPLRQRARVARIGHSAVPRADQEGRPGHGHGADDDAVPADARPGGRHRVRGRAPMRAPGEIIIPRAPSATVMDIARALVESRPVEIKVTESGRARRNTRSWCPKRSAGTRSSTATTT